LGEQTRFVAMFTRHSERCSYSVWTT